MLVAALAGVGILLAVALLIFSGGDEAAEQAKLAGDKSSASATAGENGPGSKSAFSARKVDGAEADKLGPIAESQTRPRARLNPAIEKRMVKDGMQAAPAVPPKPPEFESPNQERDWWQRQLTDAERLKGMRQRAIDKLPEMEKGIPNTDDPEAARRDFDNRKQRLENAMARSIERIAELEDTLRDLG